MEQNTSGMKHEKCWMQPVKLGWNAGKTKVCANACQNACWKNQFWMRWGVARRNNNVVLHCLAFFSRQGEIVSSKHRCRPTTESDQPRSRRPLCVEILINASFLCLALWMLMLTFPFVRCGSADCLLGLLWFVCFLGLCVEFFGVMATCVTICRGTSISGASKPRTPSVWNGCFQVSLLQIHPALISLRTKSGQHHYSVCTNRCDK